MSESSSSPQRIWVVDDDRAVRFVLCTALREAGYQVVDFDSAAAALQALGEGAPPALLFTDVRMPGDDGLVLLDKLKAALPQLPVVVMSAYTDVASTAGAFRGGAHEFPSAVRPGRCRGAGAARAAGGGAGTGSAHACAGSAWRPTAATGG